ncbi:MAG: ATP-binding cassette domain-containing protein [Bacteroidia bacterium]
MRLLGVERSTIGYIYLYAIFTGLINLSLPLGIQAILGLTLANEISSSWIVLVVAVTVGTALAGVLQIMQISLTEVLQQRIFARSSFEFAYRIPRLRLEPLMKYYPPELVNRFFDTMTIQKGLPKILIDFSTALLQIIFGLILLSFYHPFFVIFGIGLLLLLVLIIRLTGPKGLQTSLEESDYKYQVVFWLEEMARALSSFKLAGDTPMPLKKTDELVSQYLGARKKHFRVLVTQYANIIGFKTIITAVLLILGSVLLMQREINLGQFVASEIVIILIISSVEKLVLSAETIYDVFTAVEKIGKVTDMPLERHEGLEVPPFSTERGLSIKVKDLTFSYPGDTRPSLFHLSFEVNAGEKVCISGFNGSGKTLLLNVISGLYENYSGILAYNDIPAGNYDPIALRNSVGDCLSQKVLFRGTLIENITMDKEDVSMDDALWALERVGLMDFIQSLPKGLDTMILPDGPRFPESIVRKLILARCIAKRPLLLVVEDFFSILTRDERRRLIDFLVCDEISTLLIVSNDPDVAARCDKVFVMQQGTIVDSGTYETISQRPYAANLYNL